MGYTILYHIVIWVILILMALKIVFLTEEVDDLKEFLIRRESKAEIIESRRKARMEDDEKRGRCTVYSGNDNN